jgi:hypothetical protein
MQWLRNPRSTLDEFVFASLKSQNVSLCAEDLLTIYASLADEEGINYLRDVY